MTCQSPDFNDPRDKSSAVGRSSSTEAVLYSVAGRTNIINSMSGRVCTVHDVSFIIYLRLKCQVDLVPLWRKYLFLESKGFMTHAELSSLRKSFCSMETEVISHRGKISRKEAYFGGLASHWDLLTAAE